MVIDFGAIILGSRVFGNPTASGSPTRPTSVYNNEMARRFLFCSSKSLFRIASAGLLTACVALNLASAQDTAKRGRKYKSPPPTANVEVTVLRATNGKPVENASVIFHPLENGRDSGNMELKTNEDGKAKIDLLAIGSSVRVQVISPGFQTYGEDYKVDKDTMAIEVKLKRPGAQYSIYNKSEGNEPDKNKPTDSTAPTAPTAPTDPKASNPNAPKANADAPKDTPADGSATDAAKPAPASDAKPQDPPAPK